MNNHGIDYSGGTANYDAETGIHYGVIPMNALTEWAWEELESDYGDAHCPKCGNNAVAGDSELDELADPECVGLTRNELNYKVLHYACGDFACDTCRLLFDDEDAYGDEPCGHTLDRDGYTGFVGSDGIDLMLVKSDYFTHAQYCSPCAPGACYLLNPTDRSGPRAYCLSHNWFEGGKAPYPVWRVSDGSLVKPEQKAVSK